MSRHTRRRFMQLSGAVLGGIATGTTVVAATRTDRFIARTRGKRIPKGLDVVHEMPGVKYVVVEGAARDLDSSKAVKEYVPDVEIELQEPDVNDAAPTVEDASALDEDAYGLQWDKQDLNVPEAHETTQGEGTRVAVIDSGVYADHPDLNVNTDLSRNFTDDDAGAGVPAGDDHGTHVAGIVAAADNGTGVVGTAPETDLVDCRVFSYAPGASFADILAAVVYSANIDADVANLSLGAYPVPRQANGQFYGKVLNSAMTYANKEGTLLVIAAGNDSADLQHDNGEQVDVDGDGELETLQGGGWISLPNEGAQALSVSATGPIGFQWGDDGLESPPESPAFYTNYGTNAVTIGAPGGDADLSAVGTGAPYYYDLVFNTTAAVEYETEDIDGDGEEEPVEYLGAEPTYGWKAGTSMAAPNVAGAAALVKSANPDYNANQVESALKGAAEVPDDYGKEYYGAGYLNVLDAL